MMGGVVVFPIWRSISRSKAKAQRKKDYDEALAALANDPENNGLRASALERGRAHYGGLRKEGAPTIYDESAINNDITARLGSRRN